MFGFKLYENEETKSVRLELWQLNNNTEKETFLSSLMITNHDLNYIKNNLDGYKKELLDFIFKHAIDFETTIIDAYLNH